MTIEIFDVLNKPHDENNSDLTKIISGRLKKLGRERNIQSSTQSLYWSGGFFGLDNSQVYSNMSELQKYQVLAQCNESILLESYFIEKLGMAYCAKMSLTSETVESSQVYSLIGADEATHLRWITPYVSSMNRTSFVGKFLEFLTVLVDQGDVKCLVLPLQIILEGWGLQHYQLLAEQCLNADLKNIFEDIVRDEALHHQAGVALYNPDRLSVPQTQYMLDCIATFIEMIRVGPQSIINVVDTVSGGMTRAEKITLIEELSGTISSAKKLIQIRKLMMIPGNEKMVEYFDSINLFQAHPAECCI